MSKKKSNPGGRPRKFQESSRPITVTLPERILKLLEAIDVDRAKAISKLVDLASDPNSEQGRSVELVEVESNQSIIFVGPSRALRKISWLKLVEIAPLRFLLVIPSGTAIESLEVAVMDLIEELAEDDRYERDLLTELQRCLTMQRREQKLSKAELLLIDTPGE